MAGPPDGVSKRFLEAFPLRLVRVRENYHWFVVGTVCVGAFMAALDASVINVALPQLGRQFGRPMQVIEWVSLVYLLTLAGLIVPLGRLADMMGRRWMYALGFTVFILASLMCGFSHSLAFLLCARVVQAMGAAMLQANSVSIITAATPAKSLGKAIGVQASAQGIGLSIGPAIGGALLMALDWRWIFFINIPVGVIGTVLGILLLPRDNERLAKSKFDFLGTFLLIPTLAALMFVLNAGVRQGWGSPGIILSSVVFAAGLIAFVFVERQSASPIIDLSLFRRSTFTLGNLSGVLTFTVMYAVLLLAPFYLDNVRGMSAWTAGLYLTLIPIGMTLLTPISGVMADKYGARVPSVFGMCFTMCGCLSLSFIGVKSSLVPFVAGLFLAGVGVGMFTPPNNSSVMGSVPSHRLGVAGGILNMSRSLGMGLGVTIGGLAYQLFLGAIGGLHDSSPEQTHMVWAFRGSFVCLGVVAFIVLLMSVSRRQGQVNPGVLVTPS